tara:strand:- start:263 stop:472 length:210 start_codon:yes stop_codon:yes gene_type:complete
MSEQNFFTKMVDDLVEYSKCDPELADGIRYLDGLAQKNGKTFYDMVYELLYKRDVNTKARNWLMDKHDS